MAVKNSSLLSQRSSLFSSFSCFKKKKKKGELSDVTIRVGSRILSANRDVLAAEIPYFQAMFTSDLAESKQKEITMKGLDTRALERLINFAYTGKVKITIKNVQSLLIASEFLQIAQVRDSCCDFLSERFNPSNVIKYLTFADNWNCFNLTEKCDRYIRQHFDEFSQTKEFLRLPFSIINELIRRDDLRVKNEERVFQAVMCWVKTEAKRQSLLPELLTGIRMTYLNPQFLAEVVSKEKLILDSSPCRNLLDEAKLYDLLSDERPTRCSFTVSKRCYTRQKGIYLFCAEAGDITVYKYICEIDDWSVLPKGNQLHYPMYYSHALDDQIYNFMFGLWFVRFNPMTYKWDTSPESPVSNVRDITAVPYGKRIYFLANSHKQSDAFYFEPEENKWHPYQQHISFSDATLVPSSEGIYILNGLFKENNCKIRKSKMYNPETKEITGIPNMPTKRHGLGCAVLDGKIYACGGKDYSEYAIVKCTEVYDPFDGEWRTCSEMNTARWNFSLVPYNNKLYAVGGLNSDEPLRSFECYDPTADKWTLLYRLDGHYDRIILAVSVQ